MKVKLKVDFYYKKHLLQDMVNKELLHFTTFLVLHI